MSIKEKFQELYCENKNLNSNKNEQKILYEIECFHRHPIMNTNCFRAQAKYTTYMFIALCAMIYNLKYINFKGYHFKL